MADLVKTHPSRYLLLYRIWSFCFKGRRLKYRRTTKTGERWNSALLGWEVWLTPRYTPLLHMCYLVERGRSVLGVVIDRTEPKIGERWGSAPFGWRRGRPPNNKPPPHMCYHIRFGSSATEGECIKGNPQNWGALGSAH